MGVDAEAGIGELGHVGAAHEDQAGGAEPRDHWAILCRRRALSEYPGTGSGHLARDVEQVLDRDWDPVESGEGLARAAARIGRVRRRPYYFNIKGDEHAGAFARRVPGPGQAALDEGAAGRPAGGQILGKLTKRLHVGIPDSLEGVSRRSRGSA